MNPQLQAVITNYESAQQRLHSLMETTAPELAVRRPRPDSWSVAECVEHLNLTSRAFLPLIRAGLADARRLGVASGKYRMDVAGWLLSKALPPPVWFRTRTSRPFEPRHAESVDGLLRDFDQLQAELVSLVCEADTLPIDRIRIVSPFSSRVKYNIYSSFMIIPIHQHRHIWQAETAVEHLKLDILS